MMHIFVTGEIGIGKSTLVLRLLSLYPDRKTYGFFTKKEPLQPEGQSHVYIHPAQETERHYSTDNCIAICTQDCVQVNRAVMETTGVSLLSDIPADGLVVMDELGFMESEAPVFCSKVLSVLDSSRTIIGALRDAGTPFLDAVRNHPDVALYRMTMHNRDTLFDQIRDDILNDKGIGR